MALNLVQARRFPWELSAVWVTHGTIHQAVAPLFRQAQVAQKRQQVKHLEAELKGTTLQHVEDALARSLPIPCFALPATTTPAAVLTPAAAAAALQTLKQRNEGELKAQADVAVEHAKELEVTSAAALPLRHNAETLCSAPFRPCPHALNHFIGQPQATLARAEARIAALQQQVLASNHAEKELVDHLETQEQRSNKARPERPSCRHKVSACNDAAGMSVRRAGAQRGCLGGRGGADGTGALEHSSLVGAPLSRRPQSQDTPTALGCLSDSR